MTLGAQLTAFLFQHVFGLGAVRVMAISTIILGRGMDHLHIELGLTVFMALKTEGAPG